MINERIFVTHFSNSSFLVFDAADSDLAREYADFRAGQIGTKVTSLAEITDGNTKKLSTVNPSESQRFTVDRR